MFWLHGGAFTFGSSTEKIYNGASLAASECVIVASTNYRHAGGLLMHSCCHGADFRRCNILTGSSKDEGTFALSLLRPATYNFRSQQPLVNFTDQELQDTLTQLLSLTFKPEFIPGILAAVPDLYNYTSLQQAAPNPSFSLLKSLATDMVHSCPTRLLATFYANRTQNAYLYSLEHTRDNTTFPDWVGATHVSEVPLVFGTITPDWPAFSPREVKLKQAIMHFWANFAKYGNPTPYPWDTPRWPKYSPPDPASVLRFTQCTAVRVGRTERKPCDYWNSLPREYYKP